jgi:hypothetical protein
LDRDARQLFRREIPRRRAGRRRILAVAVIEPDEDVPVHAVGGEEDQHDEVGNEDERIEPVRAVKAFKGLIELAAHEVANATALHGQREKTQGCRE